MTARTDGERLAVLESGMTNIQSEIIQLRTEIGALTKSVDQLVQSKLTDHVRLTNDLDTLNSRVGRIENQNKPINRWITHTLAAVVGAILLFLIQFFLTHK